MKKYQAKTRKIIEAQQFLPPGRVPKGVFNVYRADQNKDIYTGRIRTAQGVIVDIKPGEWVVKEAEAYPDRYYPIADEIFQQLYEPFLDT